MSTPNDSTKLDLIGPLKPEVLRELEALSTEADLYVANRHPEDSLTWRYLASIQALLIRLHNKHDAQSANSNQSLLSAAAPDLLDACKALIRAYEIVVSNGGGSFNRHFPDAAGKGYAAIRKAEGR